MRTPEMLFVSPVKTTFVRGPADALVGRPAGIESLRLSVEGDESFHDLNSKFFEWIIDSDRLKGLVAKNREKIYFWGNLALAGINYQRLEEVLENANDARDSFKQLGMGNISFTEFVRYKGIIQDVTRVASASQQHGIGEDRVDEEISLARNSIGYWNKTYDSGGHVSRAEESREGLLKAAETPGIFKEFIDEYAVPALLAESSNVLAFSVTHPAQYAFTFQLAAAIRQKDPNVILILGGNTVTRRPDTWTKNDSIGQRIFRKNRGDTSGIFDAVMIGEGEEPFAILTDILAKNPNISTQELFRYVPSIVYNHKDLGIVMRRLASPKKPEQFYKKERNTHTNAPKTLMLPDSDQNYSLVFGRVCTYECSSGGCTYCSISKGYNEKVEEQLEYLGIEQLEVESLLPDGVKPLSLMGAREFAQLKLRQGRKIEQRVLDPDFVADELAKAYEAGFTIADITDEQLTVAQVSQIGAALDRRGLKGKIKLAAYFRTDDYDPDSHSAQEAEDLLMDPETAKKLADSGLAFVQFGLETTSRAKIRAMRKGTSIEKVDRFKSIIKNFSDADIMTHVFLIVGAPLKRHFWENRDEFEGENAALGREVEADDLEIFEAMDNLVYLHELRNYIFTMKHTQYKLSFGSPDSRYEEVVEDKISDEGIANLGFWIDTTQWQKNDLACNIPFKYLDGYGPRQAVITTLLEMYDLWKKEVLPYQPITQELMYHQRLLPQFGAAGIRDLATNYPPGEDRLTEAEKAKKLGLLQRLYAHLAGQDYIDLSAKVRKQPTHKLSQEQFAAIKDRNLFTREFPNGFRSYEDLYNAADLLEEERNKAKSV